jgi:hypothetical protein
VIPGDIEYRHTEKGKKFLDDLKQLKSIDKHYIQIGCADWFWDQQVNSFVLQIEPERFKYQDKCLIDYHEGIYLENVRNKFFELLQEIISHL